MIATLSGTLIEKTPGTAVVDVHGVGYLAFIPLSTFYRMPEPLTPVSLLIHTHVREDALHLYGFLTPGERELFVLLQGISGIGPKFALNILSRLAVADFVAAVRDGNAQALASIPGIGPKRASRLVLELQDKVAGIEGAVTPGEGGRRQDTLSEDALSALVNLGYARSQARQAIKAIQAQQDGAGTLEELIRGALAALAH